MASMLLLFVISLWYRFCSFGLHLLHAHTSYSFSCLFLDMVFKMFPLCPGSLYMPIFLNAHRLSFMYLKSAPRWCHQLKLPLFFISPSKLQFFKGIFSFLVLGSSPLTMASGFISPATMFCLVYFWALLIMIVYFWVWECIGPWCCSFEVWTMFPTSIAWS